MSDEPYIIEERIEIDYKYNPDYGDDRMCKCGHPYYRHFDTYEDMYACGCKYCDCHEFKEIKDDDYISVDDQLPDIDRWVLVKNMLTGETDTMWITNERSLTDIRFPVTHWRYEKGYGDEK